MNRHVIVLVRGSHCKPLGKDRQNFLSKLFDCSFRNNGNEFHRNVTETRRLDFDRSVQGVLVIERRGCDQCK